MIFYRSFSKVCLLGLALGLVACATEPSAEGVAHAGPTGGATVADENVTVGSVLPLPYSMLDVARAMSKGSVDIYDPNVTSFANVVHAAPSPDPLAAFPIHQTMVIRDPHVRVYSLASRTVKPAESFDSVLNTVRTGEAEGDSMPPVPLAPVEVFTP